MYKTWFILFIFALLSQATQAQTTQHNISHDNIKRSYRLYVPEHYNPDAEGHLIMVLHGGGMTAQQMINHTGQRFHDLVDDHEANVIVVYPNGLGNGWNDGRERESQLAFQQNIDDVDFLLTLADDLATDYNINPNEIFVTGFSNGAGMAYRLACEQADRIHAIAPVANLIASTLTCEPSASVGVMLMMGDEDPIVPLSGGDLYYWDTPLGSVLSLDETLEIWHNSNDCDGYGDIHIQPDIDPDDGTETSIQYALDCDQSLIILMVHGGGHTWSGSPLYTPEEEYGRTTHNIDSAVAAFSLFLSEGLAIRESISD